MQTKDFPFLNKILRSILASLIIISVAITLLPNGQTLARANFQVATPLPDPLSTPLPTASPPPTSDWWPPLYPVPWSKGENDHFYFIRPLDVDDGNWLKRDYGYGAKEFGNILAHTGIDIAAPIGTPVLAAGPGQVIWVGYGLLNGYPNETDPYGLAIAIKHDFGFKEQPLFTIYAHLSEIKVSKGQLVEIGDIIGLSGETGHAIGEHLHFEVRIGANNYNNTSNPELWVAPPQGWGVLVGRVNDSWGNPLFGQSVEIINLDTGEEVYGKSYNSEIVVNKDPYFNENFVMSGLPAGNYEILVPYVGQYFSTFVTIKPGVITYFSFDGYFNINFQMPPPTAPENLPIP